VNAAAGHPRIPESWNAITPAWATTAIANHHPDARVGSVELLWHDDGTNRRVRIGLQYTGGNGPATLFIKSNDPAHRAVHLRNGNLFNEAQLFTSGIDLPLDHPRVYESVVDREGGNFLLVMEDLVARGAEPRDATRPMSVAQVMHGVRNLGRLHSRYWNFSADTQPALAWVQAWAPTEGWQVGLRKRVPIGLQRAGDLLPPALRAYDGNAIVDLWARYVATLSQDPVTLLHGDAHIGNTYVLPNDDVGFLDWQVVRRGNWSQDVGYFLVSALTEDNRRRSERDLIEAWCSTLDVPDAQRPSIDIAWLHYRASQAYGLAIWLSTLGTDGWQAPAISRALVQRYATAFIDLDTREALDALTSLQR
jgi:Ser/Thr protein kinase RdoA (MazF antagonist)